MHRAIDRSQSNSIETETDLKSSVSIAVKPSILKLNATNIASHHTDNSTLGVCQSAGDFQQSVLQFIVQCLVKQSLQ